MPRIRSFWAWGLESDEPTPQQMSDAAAAVSFQHLPLVHPFAPLGFGRVQLQYHR